MKKFFKILGISILSIVGLLLIGIAVFLIIVAVNSPGKLEPLKDSAGNVIVGSLAEKNFVEIGGIQQGYFVRAKNPENPVILFLHGGPGSPLLPSGNPLERYFTMVYWEQRGSGISFSTSIDPATMTLTQVIEDTRQITEHLQERFGQDRIFLMGHSWGTFLGVKTIEKYPELFHAYIGIAQISNQGKSEKLLYDFLLQHAKETGNQRAVRDLQRFDRSAPDFPTLDYMRTARARWMNEFGVGMVRNEPVSVGDMFRALLSFRGYTLVEKINWIRGGVFSFVELGHYVGENLFETSTSFDIPVFIMHGVWDYQVSYTLAREWFDVIEAPNKAFFSFENSAHSPNMEEPEKFVQIVREIVARVKQ